MLYDPKWKQQTKSDRLSMAGLITWLEKQQPGKGYNYHCSGHCLAAQFLASMGLKYRPPGARNGRTGFVQDLEDIAVKLPHTFGAALDRARNWRGPGC